MSHSTIPCSGIFRPNGGAADAIVRELKEAKTQQNSKDVRNVPVLVEEEKVSTGYGGILRGVDVDRVSDKLNYFFTNL